MDKINIEINSVDIMEAAKFYGKPMTEAQAKQWLTEKGKSFEEHAISRVMEDLYFNVRTYCE